MKTLNKIILSVITITTVIFAHGDVTPQMVDTKGLEKVSDDVTVNPFRGNKIAIKIGKSGYNSNCARCHGLGAVSGGIAPDLRSLPVADDDVDEYYNETVKLGVVRNGNIYMPPFDKILSAEAIWSIRAWLETLEAE